MRSISSHDFHLKFKKEAKEENHHGTGRKLKGIRKDWLID
jgi:hypothetical protein